MSMTNISVTEDQFKTASNRLSKAINARLLQDKTIGHAWMLEALSQALWQKPYGEVKETLLADSSPVPAKSAVSTYNQPGRVHILHYGSEDILLLDGDYVTGSFPGTDLEVPFKVIESQAASLAGSHDSFVKKVRLPEILDAEYETDDIIQLAGRLGYFRYNQPLLDAIEESDVIHLNGEHCPFALDGDFENDFLGAVEMEDFESAMKNHAVWHTEIYSEGDHYEFFFSLADIGNAEEVSPGVWSVREGESDNQCYVKFLFEQKPR